MRNFLFLIAFLSVLYSCTNRPTIANQPIAAIDSVKNVSYDTTTFDFEPDIRLFTLMAFGNASGYDFENDSMLPQRKELREYLDSVLTDGYKEKIKGLNKKNGFFYFGINAFNLSYPPNFRWLPDSLSVKMPYVPKKDSALLRIINEFYVEAKVSQLWEKYQPVLRDYNYSFCTFSSGISDITNYCRVDSDYFEHTKFVIQICPFMQNHSGFTCRSSSNLYIVATPREAGPEIFYHEPLHHIVNPIISKYGKELMQIRDASRIGSEIRMKKASEYLGIDALAAESLTRTIDYVLRAKHYHWNHTKIKSEINRQYSLGLSLIPFFYEELKKYEASDLTLEQYFPRMLQSYDLKKEQARWQSFNDSIK